VLLLEWFLAMSTTEAVSLPAAAVRTVASALAAAAGERGGIGLDSALTAASLAVADPSLGGAAALPHDTAARVLSTTPRLGRALLLLQLTTDGGGAGGAALHWVRTLQQRLERTLLLRSSLLGAARLGPAAGSAADILAVLTVDACIKARASRTRVLRALTSEHPGLGGRARGGAGAGCHVVRCGGVRARVCRPLIAVPGTPRAATARAAA
jgi:hypothetical protein